MSINYRPILPSSLLEIRKADDMSFTKKLSENMSLRLGVVIEIYEVDNKENVSKLTPEYDVMTIENDNTVKYKNCMAIDSLGGIADYFTKKLRKPKDSKKVRDSGSLKNQNGSIVLMLCIDGSSEQAIILGAIQHPDRKNGKLTKELGHHMEGEFNGLNWKVDKDGALTITFKSATDNDGKAKDTKTGGTTLKIDKTGSVDVNTNLTGDGETYIRMDKTNKDVGLKAGQHIGLTAKKNIGLTADAKINIKAKADILADAGGSFTAKSGGPFNITSEGPVSIKAPDLKIAVDNMCQIKASTVSISSPSIMVGDGGTPAVILTTQALGVGNLGMPVISTFIGPFSSSVFIGS